MVVSELKTGLQGHCYSLFYCSVFSLFIILSVLFLNRRNLLSVLELYTIDLRGLGKKGKVKKKNILQVLKIYSLILNAQINGTSVKLKPSVKERPTISNKGF